MARPANPAVEGEGTRIAISTGFGALGRQRASGKSAENRPGRAPCDARLGWMNQRILIDQLDPGSGHQPEETAGTPLEEAERPGQESQSAAEGAGIDLGDCQRRGGEERDAQRRDRINPRR